MQVIKSFSKFLFLIKFFSQLPKKYVRRFRRQSQMASIWYYLAFPSLHKTFKNVIDYYSTSYTIIHSLPYLEKGQKYCAIQGFLNNNSLQQLKLNFKNRIPHEKILLEISNRRTFISLKFLFQRIKLSELTLSMITFAYASSKCSLSPGLFLNLICEQNFCKI